MRGARFGGSESAFHLGADPCVMSVGILGRRELGLDGGEFGHAGSVADGRVRANPGGDRLVRYGLGLMDLDASNRSPYP